MATGAPARNMLAAMRLPGRGVDTDLMSLIEDAGRNVQRAGLLLRDLLSEYPERAALAQDLKVCEQEGDRITRDIIHRLAAGGAVAHVLEGITLKRGNRWRA